MAFDAGTIKAKFVADTGGFELAIGKVKDLVGNVAGAAKLAFVGVGAVAAAAAGFTGAGFALAQSASKIGDQFQKMSKRTGIASGDLSGLAFAAQQSGTDISSLEGSLQAMVTKLRSARDGSKIAKGAFERLGISIFDANGNLRPMKDLLLEASDTLKELPEGTERAAAAQDLFGRSASNILPLLEQGSDGIQGLIDKADDLGVTIDGPLADSSARFQDAIGEMKSALSGVRIELGRRLIPLFQPLVKGVTKAIGKFRRWIAKSDTIKRIFGTMSQLIDTLKKSVGKLVSSRAWSSFLDLGSQLADDAIGVISDLVDWIDSRLPSALDALAPVISQVGELIKVTFEVIIIAGGSALTVINDAFGTASSTATSSLQGIRELAKLTLITVAELLKLLVAAAGAGLVLFQSGDRLRASLADIGRLGQQIEDAQRAIADIGIVGPPQVPQIQGVTQPDGRLATQTGNRGRRRDTAETTVNITQNFATAPITTRQELSALMLEGIEAAAKLGQRTANFDPAATTATS